MHSCTGNALNYCAEPLKHIQNFIFDLCPTFYILSLYIGAQQAEAANEMDQRDSATDRGDEFEGVVHPNEAYTSVLNMAMGKNEAYQRVRNQRNCPALEQPHVYDEIGPESSSVQVDPVYAEISEPVGMP